MEEIQNSVSEFIIFGKKEVTHNKNQHILTSNPTFGKNEGRTSFNNKNKHILGLEHCFCQKLSKENEYILGSNITFNENEVKLIL